MERIPTKTISEIIDTASIYCEKLEHNLHCILNAEEQVNLTSEESLKEIDATFDELTKSVLDALNKRREFLKNAVTRIQEEGLEPLRACKEVLKQTLKHTKTYICQGQNLILNCDSKHFDFEGLIRFLDHSSSLGNLPAVPNPEEVPAVTFQLNVDSVRDSLVSTVLSAGCVSRMGPVQISRITEKPGGLLVHWEEVDDRGIDDHNFRLQVAVGAHGTPRPSSAVYRNVYQGPENIFMVRDLKAGTLYTLRVCCGDDISGWCPWSLPRVASTSLPAFRWSASNPHYTTTVEGKIAHKTDKVKSILLSNTKQFGPDHSIEFTVLECPDMRQPTEGVGIMDTQDCTETLVQKGCLFINSQGHIFVDGVEKMTRLPELERGSRVTFTCEPLNTNRIRVHVDSGDKAVTYDWKVSSTALYFGTQCIQPGWKLMVE